MANEIQKTEQNQIAPSSPAGIMMQMASSGGEFDVDKMSKLLEVQERYEANEAKKAYNKAMSEFQSNTPKIIKQKKGHNCVYAGLDDIVLVIAPILSQCGLSHSWTTEMLENQVKVICKIKHVLGHSETGSSLSAGFDTSGSKNAVQAIGSTITYLQRYTLKASLGLAEVGQDDDGVGADDNKEPIVPEIDNKVKKAAEAIGKILEQRTGKKINQDRMLGIFFSVNGSYPQHCSRADDAANWLINLNRQSEWAVEPLLTKQGEAVQKVLKEAYALFIEKHRDFPAEGISDFSPDKFSKAVVEAFTKVPTSKAGIKLIVEEIKPEDVILTM